ncbi:hypothetical protein [Desulfolucanica intricata]|uniref:hypothetical protein n=1 Tax=Desulfolucanica intricata TaxID=1285191 RepID=UPI00082B2D92|nr:hypothetical protein [Desulfolucanica intricata]
MRQLTPSEVLSLREMLQMESNALAKAQATRALITDDDLKSLADSSIKTMEARIKSLQQFIVENNIVSTEEVH